MSITGKKIKEIRIKRGLSQEDLSESAKVNLRTIQRIENNETTPREKTLKLIVKALNMDDIENNKGIIDKSILWSSFLTILIIISSFLGWYRTFKYFLNGERIYNTRTGWYGFASFFDYHFPNWLVTISTITIGLIVVSHSFGLVKNKMKYILLQLICLFFYLLGLFNYSFVQSLELRPGLFMIVVATILLVIAYKKN